MSENKRQRIELKSDLEMSDSFDVRVWDDLSEELLQYLTIEDKLRLECVSKQFQRTVFMREKKIILDKEYGNRESDETIDLVYDCKRVAKLFKKIPNITDITIN